VIQTRNAMRDANDVITLVTGRDQVANVRRLAERAGWTVTVAETEGGWALHMLKGDAQAEPEVTPDLTVCATPNRRVLVVSGDRMGRGEPELGEILIKSFFYALKEVDARPGTLIFFNAGVKLAIEGSPALDDLQALAEDGVEILVCGTCLDYFDLKDRVAVGTVSNMYTIAETMLGADHTVVL
jgi:selenium metabolism protein YedF